MRNVAFVVSMAAGCGEHAAVTNPGAGQAREDGTCAFPSFSVAAGVDITVDWRSVQTDLDGNAVTSTLEGDDVMITLIIYDLSLEELTELCGADAIFSNDTSRFIVEKQFVTGQPGDETLTLNSLRPMPEPGQSAFLVVSRKHPGGDLAAALVAAADENVATTVVLQ